MCQSDEPSGKILLRSCRAVVDQPAILQGRIPAEDATLHCHIDADAIHVADLRLEIEELRMHRRIPRFHRLFLRRVQAKTSSQLRRYVVVLEIDNHDFPPDIANARLSMDGAQTLTRWISELTRNRPPPSIFASETL